MFPRLKAWWRSKEQPQDAPAPRQTRIRDDVISAASRKPERITVFSTPDHPPGVVPQGAKLAMDGVPEIQSWANQAVLDSFWTEGITFLGYAYLSELAQRPEYRVISETIATEMTREWIEFFSTDDDDDAKAEKIAELDAEFKRLNVAGLFARATQQDGFFGRGHIYIDTGDTDDPAELQKGIGDGWDAASKAKMAKKPIKNLRTVEAVWCYPTSYNSNDPLKDDWYRPNSWYVQAKIVHSSRLITFIGREVPDLLKPTYSFGGLSLSQMAKPYVDNWLQTRQAVNSIISSFVIPVLSTDLQTSIQDDGDQLFRRAALFNLLKSNQGLMILNKDTETFDQKAAPLSGLDTLQAQAQEHMAAVSHIPTVKLLGIQPAGLNASSEDQMRVFYDYIHAYQEHLFRDKIKRLMGLVMLSIWGEQDETIDFLFKPLWALSEEQAATMRKTEAETDQILIDAGVVSQEEARKRVASDPDSGYSSIDVDEMPDLLDEEETGLEPEGGRPELVATEVEEKKAA